MSRSRSSFELDGAIATATSLEPRRGPQSREPEAQEGRHYAGVKLVSFGAPAPARPRAPGAAGSRPVGFFLLWWGGGGAGARQPEPGDSSPPPTQVVGRPPPPPRPVADVGEGARDSEPAPTQHAPPKLPDLSAVVSPIVRCEKIVAWIAEATGATEVFLADAAGLPLAGAIHEAESRLAGSGLVASSIGSLAEALPGNPSPLFELHVGEGPFFQLIGFSAGATVYVVGLTRPTPLTPRQAHAIRLACRHALGETLRGRA